MKIDKEQLAENAYLLGWLKFAEPGKGMELASVRHGDARSEDYLFKIDVQIDHVLAISNQTWELIQELLAQEIQALHQNNWDVASYVPSAVDIFPSQEILKKYDLPVPRPFFAHKPKKNSLEFLPNPYEEISWPQGTRAVVFEDVVNTGITDVAYVHFLASLGIQTTHVISVFEWENGAKEALTELGVMTRSVMTVTEFFRYILGSGVSLTPYRKTVMENFISQHA